MLKPYYQDDYCTIYHGDAHSVCPELPSPGSVITDPPYGISLNTRFSRRTLPPKSRKKHPVQGNDYAAVIGDDSPFDPSKWIDLSDEVFLWGANYFCQRLPQGGSWIVWDKRYGLEDVEYPGSEFELCWSKKRRQSKIMRVRWFGFCGTETQDIRTRVHPTQKPLQVMSWIIQSSDADNILDPFMGSGTTLRAAKDLGRRATGIELEEQYCEVAATRLQQEVFAL